MATLDDINILDRQPVDLEMLLKSGRQPTVEPIPIEERTPVKDFFYNNVLNSSGRKMADIARAEFNNPLNFFPATAAIGKANKVRQGIAGIGESPNIKKAKDMGFDTDKPLFHGTHAEDLKEFDPAKFGRRDQGFYGKGVYLSSQKDEATMYGPNVGEYYAKGKILELSDYSELSRLLGPKSNDFTDPTEAYKIWAGKLDKIDALPPIQKNAYQDFLKAEKYFEENLKMIPTSKVTSGPAKGQTIYQGKIKDPDYDNDIVVDDIFDKSELKEMFLIEAESSYKFRGLKDMEKNLSRFVRDLDQKESYEGVDNVADFISKKAKKAGYTGINAGTETVVFDPKNIRLTKAKFDPSKSDSANLLAGVGGVTILANQPEKPIEGNRKDM